MIRSKVTVRVPATTANLGPGYDCVGMAVDLWNELTVERSSTFSIHIEGEGADEIPRTGENFVVKGLELAFKKAGKPVPTLSYVCRNGIPFGSGLGSSSAGIVSGLLAGVVLAGLELHVHGQEEMLQMAAELEGHIDNLSPCIYGGLQLGLHNGERWMTTRLGIPAGLQCLIFTPNTPMNTAEARAMLHDKVPRDDAVFNLGRVGLLVHALATNQLGLLRMATEDALHQPVRGSQNVMPALFPIIKAALDAGADAAFLSGAGSSIMALSSGLRGERHAQASAERRDALVALAMEQTATQYNVTGNMRVTKPSQSGGYVVSISEEPDRSLGPPMRYVSTRDASRTRRSFEEVVMLGLAPDGGLYVPERVPSIDATTLLSWRNMSFPKLSAAVLERFIGPSEIPPATLEALVQRSYATFSSSHVTPLIAYDKDGSSYVLEQFHGPTCAFKDVALQFVGNLFEFFLQRRNAGADIEGGAPRHRITVLGATSGDTGSAAIQGLRGKRDVEVFILHPKGRVADVQEAQMTTVLDANVHNVAVEGAAFDDCQTAVKALFNDPEFRKRHSLAAINSINWARILAQIVYYFYAYFRWLDDVAERTQGDKVNFVVPSGNFGNCLAGFYAQRMGLPIGKLCVATNCNDIIHRFLSDSDYSSRPVVPSLAPAMDIVIPSNFERFLYFMLGDDPVRLAAMMHKVKSEGTFDLASLGSAEAARCRTLVERIFESGRASDEEIQRTIDDTIKDKEYILCPHTAAGIHVLGQVRKQGQSYICLATAHPGKFFDTTKHSTMEPLMPPQLEGLLERPRRCLLIENSVAAVAAVVEKHAKGGKDPVVASGGANSGAGKNTAEWNKMLVAFGAGVGVALLIGRLLRA